jgi:peptidoglycan/LPS O-acetylase OafA/YrhL
VGAEQSEGAGADAPRPSPGTTVLAPSVGGPAMPDAGVRPGAGPDAGPQPQPQPQPIAREARGSSGTASAGPADVPALGYVPALDGLRAVALVGVLCFHQRFAWAPGGFLGVSTFFTLSGFLIARLALGEWGRTGTLSLGGFWERRARRLLPAALVTVAGVALLAWRTGIGGQAVHGDLLASLAYVANWRFAATSGDYGQLFTDPSPVAHMWSLAIEEQFYLLFPVVFILLMRDRGRGGPGRVLRRAGAVWAALALASFASAAWVARSGSSGLAYYATTTRAAEILVGVVAAYVVVSRPGRRLLARRGVGVGLTVAAPVAVVGLAWLWHVTSLGSPALFRGVTALNSLLTVVLVVAVTRAGARGPASAVLGLWPLRQVGKVSYGAYLLHWPVFLVLDTERTHVDAPGRLFVLRVAVTFALATAMYLLVEAPLRHRVRVGRRRLATGFAIAMVGVAVLAVAVPVPVGAGYGVGVEATTAGGWKVRPSGAGAADAPDVLVLGDSVAWSIGPAFGAWNKAHPDRQLAVTGYTPFGCPLGGHEYPLQWVTGEWSPWPDCVAWHRDLADVVPRMEADVVVFTSGVFELGERRIDGEWVHIGDPAYDDWLRGRLAYLADLMATVDAPVLWMTFAHVRLRDSSDPTRPWQEIPGNDPARVDRLNELLREVVDGRPGFELVELGAWTDAKPDGGFEPDFRDGTHYQWGAADELGTWLAPQVLDAVER